jgi:hypothetical protein
MGLKKTIGAILTGDIVNSTKLHPGQEKHLFKELAERLLASHPHEFYRGDSFQAYVREPEAALKLALQCRTMAIELTEKGETIFDFRISIGIGDVNLPIDNLGVAKGKAFFLSGRQFDALGERRLAISCGEPVADIGFEVMSDYLDNIFKGMTGKQAQVILELLSGTTQQQMADAQNKSKSTISQLAAAGRWPEIERMLQQYEKLITCLLL